MNSPLTVTSKGKILIIEESSDDLRLLSRILIDEGYQVHGINKCQLDAESTRSYLQIIETLLPDLILLNFNLIENDNYESYNQIHKLSLTQQIKIIFLINFYEPLQKQRVFQIGGSDYLVKPLHIPEVIIRIETQLQLKRAYEEIKKLNEKIEAQIQHISSEIKQPKQDDKRLEDKLSQIPFQDPLTGLPNRVSMLDRLVNAISRMQGIEDYKFAVLFVNCDYFKAINDFLGHLIGDQLLVAISRRLKSCLRPFDLIAHLGEDEFAIFLEGVENVNQSKIVAQRICEKLSSSFQIDEHQIYLQISIGIVIANKDYKQPEALLYEANLAMYFARQLDVPFYQVFNQTTRELVETTSELARDLQLAIKQQNLAVHYQPIVYLSTKKIAGFEAFLHWYHTQKGWISPLEFIPTAEKVGLFLPLKCLLLREACYHVHSWQTDQEKLVKSASSLILNVNLSLKQLSQTDLLERIDQILQKTKLDRKCLYLDIIESAFIDDENWILGIIEQLKNRELKIIIDDFGREYLSKQDLQRFPVDGVKIDVSIFNKKNEKRQNLGIIKEIINQAHTLNKTVTIKGIDTKEQLALIQGLEFDYAQGNLFSKPLDAKAVPAILSKSDLNVGT